MTLQVVDRELREMFVEVRSGVQNPYIASVEWLLTKETPKLPDQHFRLHPSEHIALKMFVWDCMRALSERGRLLRQELPWWKWTLLRFLLPRWWLA